MFFRLIGGTQRSIHLQGIFTDKNIKILNNRATPTKPAIAASSRYERSIPIDSILQPNHNAERNISRLQRMLQTLNTIS